MDPLGVFSTAPHLQEKIFLHIPWPELDKVKLTCKAWNRFIKKLETGCQRKILESQDNSDMWLNPNIQPILNKFKCKSNILHYAVCVSGFFSFPQVDICDLAT